MTREGLEASVLKVSEPAEVLSYVPHAIGYAPSQSLVAISLRAPRRRIGLVARVDLADVVGEYSSDVVDDLATFLASDGAVALFVVVYTDEPLVQARNSRSMADRAFEALMCAQDLPQSVETWIVAPDGYASWGCEDPRCCPPQGRDLRDLEDTRLSTRLTLAGSAPLASRTDLALGTDLDENRRRAFEVGIRRTVRARAAAQERSELEAWRVRRARGVLSLLAGRRRGTFDADLRSQEGARAGERAGERAQNPAQLGVLAAALSDVVVRDLVLVAIARRCAGSSGESSSSNRGRASTARAASISASSLATLPHDVGAVFGAGGPAPDPDLLRCIQRRAGEAVRLSTGAMRADLLVILAWLAWWAGDGARAGVHLGEALTLVPDHRLGALIRDSLRHAVPPGWARAAS